MSSSPREPSSQSTSRQLPLSALSQSLMPAPLQNQTPPEYQTVPHPPEVHPLARAHFGSPLSSNQEQQNQHAPFGYLQSTQSNFMPAPPQFTSYGSSSSGRPGGTGDDDGSATRGQQRQQQQQYYQQQYMQQLQQYRQIRDQQLVAQTNASSSCIATTAALRRGCLPASTSSSYRSQPQDPADPEQHLQYLQMLYQSHQTQPQHPQQQRQQGQLHWVSSHPPSWPSVLTPLAPPPSQQLHNQTVFSASTHPTLRGNTAPLSHTTAVAPFGVSGPTPALIGSGGVISSRMLPPPPPPHSAPPSPSQPHATSISGSGRRNPYPIQTGGAGRSPRNPGTVVSGNGTSPLEGTSTASRRHRVENPLSPRPGRLIPQSLSSPLSSTQQQQHQQPHQNQQFQALHSTASTSSGAVEDPSVPLSVMHNQQQWQPPTIGQSEATLPPQAPVSMQCPSRHAAGLNSDVHMYSAEGGDNESDGDENPIEITLNIDIPKTSTPAAAGVPQVTVLNVNPSWHCVFVETVHQPPPLQRQQQQQQQHDQQGQQGRQVQQRIRTSIRIQFCPSPVSYGAVGVGSHRDKIRRLKTVQVIGYASRQVDLTRRICGQNLLKKGGIIIHLEPSIISFNDASYGFTLSLSSFPTERLVFSRYACSTPDEPLPLARQQNSAYCRRNLKELYYDTLSKDVVVTLQPQGDSLYAHSVVLENYGCFRTLLEQALMGESELDVNSHGSAISGSALPTNPLDVVASTSGVEEMSGIRNSNNDDVSGDDTTIGQSMVDEEGYAQPLHSQPSSQAQSRRRQQPQAQPQHPQPQQATSTRHDSQAEMRRTRIRTRLEIQGIHSNVFRAILHYMYMGHVPTAAAPLASSGRDRQLNTHLQPEAQEAGSSSSSSQRQQPRTAGAEIIDVATSVSAATSSVGIPAPHAPTPFSNTNVAAPTAATAPSPALPGEFSWRDLYEAATRFQLTGLMHLSKLVLISRLDTSLAIRELFEWAYRYWNLVPCYVSFLIENIDPDSFLWEPKQGSIGRTGEARTGGGTATTTTARATVSTLSKSALWPYHDQCPRFDDIMVMFLQMLNERKEVPMLV